MKKSLIRNLSLGSLIGGIVGFVCIFASFIGSHFQTTTDPTTGATTVSTNSVGNPALLGLAILLLVVAGIVGFVSWIMGLIRTAQIARWGWFAAVLCLGSLGALIYGFAGPETRDMATLAQAYPPPQPLPLR